MTIILSQTLSLPEHKTVSYLETSDVGTETIILLHGIGSNAASWQAQLQQGLRAERILAWNAPGYLDTSPLASANPKASDYALVLWQWLDEMKVQTVHLVGHSLGCLMAAQAAVQQPARVKSLSLLSPAQGYAHHPDREKKRQERLNTLHTLGVQGMAEKRSSALLSPNASQAQKQQVKNLMSKLNLAGYTQAVHMLMYSDIQTDLVVLKKELAIRVACGAEDGITPPSACAALAQKFNLPYTEFANAGHALAIEAAPALNTYLSFS